MISKRVETELLILIVLLYSCTASHNATTDNFRYIQKGLDSLVILYDGITHRMLVNNSPASSWPRFTLKQDRGIVIQLNNVNRITQSISLTEKSSNFFSETQLDEKEMNIPSNQVNISLQELNVPPTEFSVSSFSFDRSAKDSLNKYNAAINAIKIESAELKIQIDSLDNKIKSGIMKDSASALEKVEFTSHLNDQKNRLTGELMKNDLEQQHLTEKINNVYSSQNTAYGAIQKILTQVSQYKKAISNLVRLKELYQSLFCTINEQGQPFDYYITKRTEIIKNYFPFSDSRKINYNILNDCYDVLHKSQNEYNDLIDVYNKNILQLNSDADKQKIRDIMSEIKAFNSNIKYAAFEDLIGNIVAVYNLYAVQNFSLRYNIYSSSDDNDLSLYTIKFAQQARTGCSFPVNIPAIDFQVHYKRGWKLNVSSGVFANIGLSDKSYRFERYNQQGDSSVVRENKNRNIFSPSFGVLLHVYRRTPANTKFGGAFGVSTSNGRNLKYYFGPSLILGRNQRFIVSSGIAGGEINFLADEYEVNKPIAKPISELPQQVPLRNPPPFRIGSFVSFTFNLSSSKTNEAFTGNFIQKK